MDWLKQEYELPISIENPEEILYDKNYMSRIIIYPFIFSKEQLSKRLKYEYKIGVSELSLKMSIRAHSSLRMSGDTKLFLRQHVYEWLCQFPKYQKYLKKEYIEEFEKYANLRSKLSKEDLELEDGSPVVYLPLLE